MSRSDYGQTVKAEGNFEDHPYFIVGNQRHSDGVLNYVNTGRTRDGQELRELWTVRVIEACGPSGSSLDQEVDGELLQIVQSSGDCPRKIGPTCLSRGYTLAPGVATANGQSARWEARRAPKYAP